MVRQNPERHLWDFVARDEGELCGEKAGHVVFRCSRYQKALLQAPGSSPHCDDALAACRRFCLTKQVPRVCCHLDYGQHDLGCKSHNFQRRCVAAWLMSSASSISSHLLLEEEPSHTVSLTNYQEDVSMLRESLENLGRSRGGPRGSER